jgi:hypothetical protein
MLYISSVYEIGDRLVMYTLQGTQVSPKSLPCQRASKKTEQKAEDAPRQISLLIVTRL